MAFIRTFGKYNCTTTINDFYSTYKNSVKNPVSKKIYHMFINEYNEKIMYSMIHDALEYKMPYRIGYLRVQKKMKKPFILNGKVVTYHMSPDWKRTLEYWRKEYQGLSDEEIINIPNKKILRYHNDHTNGYSVRFYWDKRTSNVKWQSAYSFKASRTSKIMLKNYIFKNGVNIFFE